MSFVLRGIKPTSLRTKLVFWYSVVFTVSAAALVLSIYLFASHYLKAEADDFLSDETAEFVRQAAARMPDIEDLKHYLDLEIGEKRSLMPFYRMADPATGKVLMAMPEPPIGISWNHEALRRAAAGEKTVETLHSRGESPLIYRVRTVPMEAGGRILALQCGFARGELYVRLGRLKVYLGLAIVAAVFVAVTGGYVFATRSLRPMAEMLQTLRKVRSSELALRLPERPVQDEIGALTTAINTMLDELELAFDGVRSFTANAAHELRTPLAALRCELEVAIGRDRPAGEYRETLASALERTRTLSATIENLLFLAKADSSAAVPDEARVDLSGILEHVGELFEALAEAGDVNLSVDVAPGLAVSGNTEWLKMALANLLNNAVKYTPAGGRVLLSARKVGKEVRVSVEDTGPGIPPEDLERVFDRFYRADKSRHHLTGGVGLGLSITKRIIDLHGGSITVRSESGKGSTFGVLLPHGDTSAP